MEDLEDVGCVRGAPDDTDPSRAFLLSMWVAPRFRDRGIGQQLVGSVIDWARSEGFGALVLDVADDNRPAVALYAKMGFEPTGETGTLPPPREHVTEHRRILALPPARGGSL